MTQSDSKKDYENATYCLICCCMEKIRNKAHDEDNGKVTTGPLIGILTKGQ